MQPDATLLAPFCRAGIGQPANLGIHVRTMTRKATGAFVLHLKLDDGLPVSTGQLVIAMVHGLWSMDRHYGGSQARQKLRATCKTQVFRRYSAHTLEEVTALLVGKIIQPTRRWFLGFAFWKSSKNKL